MISILLAILVTLGFVVNIPFYIFWLEEQKESEELYLYRVDGKYTYFNVLDYISRVEVATNTKLSKERKLIAKWKAVCDKRGVPIKAFQKKIHRLLKEKAFGKRMAIGAFKRMSGYTKVMAVWDILVFLFIVNAIVSNFTIDSFFLRFMLVLMSLCIGTPVWMLFHRLLNNSMKRAGRKWDEKGKSPCGIHLAMAQFWGFTGGILWKDLMWQEGINRYNERVTNYGQGYYSNNNSGYSNYGRFNGGGSRGGW